MSYVGNTVTTQGFIPAVDYFNGTGSATAFTLSKPVASVAQVQAVISNVVQNPSDAYTVSGSTITFTSAPPTGTNNVYVYYTSPITQVIAPGQGTVTTTSFASSTGTGAVVLATSPTITTPTMTGQATIPTINLTGGQITFPATQSASSDANTLDDYEEGTWTFTVTNSGYGSGTTSGTYTKIGRLVTLTGIITFTSVGTATGQMTLSGLPFTASGQAYGVCREAASTGVIYYVAIDGSNIAVQNSTNGGVIWVNGYIYRLSITYIV